MSNKTRLALLWLMGTKLLDGVVTWISCGYMGTYEYEYWIRTLAGNGFGYGVAVPYLCFWAVVGMFMYYGMFHTRSRVLAIMCGLMYAFLMIPSLVGPMSHVCVVYGMGMTIYNMVAIGSMCVGMYVVQRTL